MGKKKDTAYFENPITVVEKKLGRERPRQVKSMKFALGQAKQDEAIIEIDPRQEEFQFLDTLVHEAMHIILPQLSEEAVLNMAFSISDTLWKQGYRKVAPQDK